MKKRQKWKLDAERIKSYKLDNTNATDSHVAYESINAFPFLHWNGYLSAKYKVSNDLNDEIEKIVEKNAGTGNSELSTDDKKHLFYLIQNATKKRKIVNASGNKVNSILKFVFTTKTYESVFENVVNDMREEEYLALQESRLWLARWRRFQIYPTILATVFMWISAKTAKKFIDLWKAI